MNYDIENIIFNNVSEIVKNTLEMVSDYFDGVCQINVDTGKLSYCSMSGNEVENSANKVVEVWRIPQGFDAEECCGCAFCDDCDDECHACSDNQLHECVTDMLFIGFKEDSDDILSDVFRQVQEWGYDL